MFGFLYPLWLFALAALAMPLILHLISRGRAPRVPIGSVRLVSATAGGPARRLQPSQPWLLLLRCLVLALLIGALAQPRFWGTPSDGPAAERGWILVGPELLANRADLEPIDPAFYARFDRLRDGGNVLRMLAPGIPVVRSTETVVPASGATDHWSLISEADSLAPAGTPLYVFTGDRLESLRGRRPGLARPLEWSVLALPGLNRWIERAGPARDGLLPLVVGTSQRDRTTFRSRLVPLGGDGRSVDDGDLGIVASRSGIRVDLRDGDDLASDDTVELPVESPPLGVVLLFDEERRDDAGYLSTALEAVEEFSRVSLEVATRELPPTGDERFDLLFWLAGDPVPEPLVHSLSSGGLLISDGPERFESCEREARLPYGLSAGPVTLLRCDAAEATPSGVPVWRDSSGAPLLAVERVGRGLHFRLQGRINPLWSDLPAHPALAEWLLDLVDRTAEGAVVSSYTHASDRRAAPGGQHSPRQIGSTRAGPGARRPDRSPELALWSILVLLVGLERWVATRARP